MRPMKTSMAALKGLTIEDATTSEGSLFLTFTDGSFAGFEDDEGVVLRTELTYWWECTELESIGVFTKEELERRLSEMRDWQRSASELAERREYERLKAKFKETQ